MWKQATKTGADVTGRTNFQKTIRIDAFVLGQMLRHVRRARRISIFEMALHLKTSKDTVADYENGVSEMPIVDVYKASDLLKIDPRELIEATIQYTFDNRRKPENKRPALQKYLKNI